MDWPFWCLNQQPFGSHPRSFHTTPPHFGFWKNNGLLLRVKRKVNQILRFDLTNFVALAEWLSPC